MRIHFLLLALVAFVALSQHNVDARLPDPAIRRMTEHRLLDELLQRRMEALEEMEGEQDSLQDGFDESRRLRRAGSKCFFSSDCNCCFEYCHYEPHTDWIEVGGRCRPKKNSHY